MPDSSPWIIDADESTFQVEVVERSREIPVVVDFWAPWCQPCRMLSPTLEKLAREYEGRFVLAKADIDQMPSIAAGFGVQSIPAVYGLRAGELVDYFVGLLGEPQIRAFLDRLMPSDVERLVSEARKLEASDAAAAEDKYREAIQLDANYAPAQIALAGLLLAHERADEARAIIEQLEKRGYLEDEAEKLKARLHFAAPSSNATDLESLRAAAADPKNLAAKLALAEALAARQQFEEALQLGLSVVQAGRKEFVEPARKLMVDIFRLLPEDSPLLDYRRRLSTALY